MTEDKYIVIKMSLDESSGSESYERVSYASSVIQAISMILNYSGTVGDILFHMDINHVSDIRRNVEDVWVVDGNSNNNYPSKREYPNDSYYADSFRGWFDFYERASAEALALMATSRYDINIRRKLVLASIECAEHAVIKAGVTDAKVMYAIEVARLVALEKEDVFSLYNAQLDTRNFSERNLLSTSSTFAVAAVNKACSFDKDYRNVEQNISAIRLAARSLDKKNI